MIDRFRRDLERIFEVGILIIDFLEFSQYDMEAPKTMGIYSVYSYNYGI